LTLAALAFYPVLLVLRTVFYIDSTSSCFSTLFPYRTLFRSPGRHLPVDRGHVHTVPRGGGRNAGGADAAGSGLGAGPDRRLAEADRKSTRLNSSHVKISYAVFCLKKKKN